MHTYIRMYIHAYTYSHKIVITSLNIYTEQKYDLFAVYVIYKRDAIAVLKRLITSTIIHKVILYMPSVPLSQWISTDLPSI